MNKLIGSIKKVYHRIVYECVITIDCPNIIMLCLISLTYVFFIFYKMCNICYEKFKIL